MRTDDPRDAPGAKDRQRVTLVHRQRRRSQPESEGPVPYSMLFICGANVCRSPLMAYSFAEAARGGDTGMWAISSAGVSVNAALPICDLVSRLLIQRGADADDFASHQSTRVDAEHLDGADLIVAASTNERAAIAALRPALRGRTFTLPEAVALGAEPVTQRERKSVSATSNGEEKPLAQYADILHQRRGTMIVAPLAPRRIQRWRNEIDPRDIPDVHHRRRRQHLATLNSAWGATEALHSQIAGFVAGDSAR